MVWQVTSGHTKTRRVTASTVFLKTLTASGITTAFVNLGSDHPALLEAFGDFAVREENTLDIVTCPSEMVALSCAQGYAQETGYPAAVIVHVDVGTQALAGAVHNVDRCRTPVFIYAGASPFTLNGEQLGSRNEFILTIQDVLDQPAILRQYMRHTAQINSGSTVTQTILRSLQFAMTEPKGPVYVWARREIMEEELDQQLEQVSVRNWGSIDSRCLSPTAIRTITEAVLTAKKPLIITSYAGRDRAAVPILCALAENLAIPVCQVCPTCVNIPADHPCLVNLTYGGEPNFWLREADVILVIDSDVPYIPVHNKPKADARIFHVDVDPLKVSMGSYFVDAELRCQAETTLALQSLLDAATSHELYTSANSQQIRKDRMSSITQSSSSRNDNLRKLEVTLKDGYITVPFLMSLLRKNLPQRNLVLSEAISNYPLVWNHIMPTNPGSFHTSGASSLGWSLGAAIGAALGARAKNQPYDLTTVITGDGSFMFSVPTSSFWIANRYECPFLVIILNNGGWKSPRISSLAVHPTGSASKVKSSNLHVTFGPRPVDYIGVAKAAGDAWGEQISEPAEVEKAIVEAIRVIREEKRCAVLDILLEKF